MVSPQLIDPSNLSADAIKMMVYGDVGQGKTTFAATAPNCLFISVEAGEIALAANPHEMDPRTRIVRATSLQDLRNYYWYIKNNMHGFGEFDSVVIDSLTDVQDKVLFEILSREEAKNTRRRRGAPEQRDWMEVTNTIRRMVMNFRDLPKHVIFTALYRNDKSPTGPGGYATSKIVRPEMSPAIYKAVSAYVDFLGYLQAYPEVDENRNPTGNMTRYLVFEDSTLTFSTKYRVRLPAAIPNPTFGMVQQAIREGMNNG